MRNVGLIVIAALASCLMTSCSCSQSASNGYFGVSNKKANQKHIKEFHKPKHKIQKCKGTKRGN